MRGLYFAAKKRIKTRIFCVFTLLSFLGQVCAPVTYAQSAPVLPAVGTLLSPTESVSPVLIKGMTLYPDNPLAFDFILDIGDIQNNPEQAQRAEGALLKAESEKLIKYFLAALTTPEEELWVNLSPREPDRIIPKVFGQTAMGRDLLAEDYILKQLTASLMYPEKETGKAFWEKIYKTISDQGGIKDIPVDLLNRVWIVPDKALVYENPDTNSVFVVESRLKVMLDRDYLNVQEDRREKIEGGNSQEDQISNLESPTSIIKNIILPAIEKEVNEGAHFAVLRQIYRAMILSTWYKRHMKESLLGQLYAEKNKTKGIDLQGSDASLLPDDIYNQYLQTFREGVYNYIKEEYDPQTQSVTARKYFSGGYQHDPNAVKEIDSALLTVQERGAMSDVSGNIKVHWNGVEIGAGASDEDIADAALTAKKMDIPEILDLFKTGWTYAKVFELLRDLKQERIYLESDYSKKNFRKELAATERLDGMIFSDGVFEENPRVLLDVWEEWEKQKKKTSGEMAVINVEGLYYLLIDVPFQALGLSGDRAMAAGKMSFADLKTFLKGHTYQETVAHLKLKNQVKAYWGRLYSEEMFKDALNSGFASGIIFNDNIFMEGTQFLTEYEEEWEVLQDQAAELYFIEADNKQYALVDASFGEIRKDSAMTAGQKSIKDIQEFLNRKEFERLVYELERQEVEQGKKKQLKFIWEYKDKSSLREYFESAVRQENVQYVWMNDNEKLDVNYFIEHWDMWASQGVYGPKKLYFVEAEGETLVLVNSPSTIFGLDPDEIKKMFRNDKFFGDVVRGLEAQGRISEEFTASITKEEFKALVDANKIFKVILNDATTDSPENIFNLYQNHWRDFQAAQPLFIKADSKVILLIDRNFHTLPQRDDPFDHAMTSEKMNMEEVKAFLRNPDNTYSDIMKRLQASRQDGMYPDKFFAKEWLEIMSGGGIIDGIIFSDGRQGETDVLLNRWEAWEALRESSEGMVIVNIEGFYYALIDAPFGAFEKKDEALTSASIQKALQNNNLSILEQAKLYRGTELLKHIEIIKRETGFFAEQIKKEEKRAKEMIEKDRINNQYMDPVLKHMEDLEKLSAKYEKYQTSYGEEDSRTVGAKEERDSKEYDLKKELSRFSVLQQETLRRVYEIERALKQNRKVLRDVVVFDKSGYIRRTGNEFIEYVSDFSPEDLAGFKLYGFRMDKEFTETGKAQKVYVFFSTAYKKKSAYMEGVVIRADRPEIFEEEWDIIPFDIVITGIGDKPIDISLMLPRDDDVSNLVESIDRILSRQKFTNTELKKKNIIKRIKFLGMPREAINDFLEMNNENSDLAMTGDFVSAGKTDQDLTVNKVGGIDLNPALLDLQIKRDKGGIPLPLASQNLDTIRIQGIMPVILNITPVADLSELLGF